jgi:hypothetical protein
MRVNAVRWALIDTLHHETGLKRPVLNFSRLQANLEAFQLAVEHNYRYYQFHASTTLAAAFYCAADQWARGTWPPAMLVAFVLLEAVLIVTSRDNLQRFYARTEQILG